MSNSAIQSDNKDQQINNKSFTKRLEESEEALKQTKRKVTGLAMLILCGAIIAIGLSVTTHCYNCCWCTRDIVMLSIGNILTGVFVTSLYFYIKKIRKL